MGNPSSHQLGSGFLRNHAQIAKTTQDSVPPELAWFWHFPPPMRSLSSLLLSFASVACLGLVTLPPAAAQAEGAKVAKADVVDFAIGPKESTKLFGTAQKNWEAVFKPSEMKATLKGLASGKTQMSEALKKDLYVVRKSSAIIRSSFQLLDNGHMKPKALDRYVKAAGKLNDAINAGQTEKIPDLAKKTLRAMKVKAIRAEVKGFKPTSKKSFNGYLYTSMLFAERAGSGKAVNAPVFHQLRKEMTNMLVLFDPSAKMSPAMQKLHDRLHKIRFSMGDVHDELVAKKTKNPADYNTKKVKLTKMTRQDVRNVIRSIHVETPAAKTLHYNRWKANVKPGRGGTKAAPKRAR